MITNIFSRSNPMNFVVVAILLFIAFGLTSLRYYSPDFTLKQSVALFAVLPLLMFSVFFIDFISKKNNLNKNDTYSILFFILFLCLLPDFFSDFQVVLSNLFVLFALRKLLSLQSLIAPKQKIFDASFWIATAAVFQWEALLFLVLVFVSIIIHASNDFKNWIIPFVGVFAVAILIVLYVLMFDYEFFSVFLNKFYIGFNYQNIIGLFDSFSSASFVILLFLFLLFQFSSIGKYLIITQNAIKKMLAFLILAFLIFIISDENKKSLLLYCIAPMSIIAANFINALHKKWIKEAFVLLLFALVVVSFFELFSGL